MKKFLVVVLLIVIIAAGVVLGVRYYKDGKAIPTIIGNDEEKVEEVKEPQTFKGNDRPIAVMIDNHSDAMPQAGLNKAYAVYEVIAESGITRLITLFKGEDLDKIGPVRSARHYFLDYVLENDAIFVHHGYSPQAKADINSLSIADIDGMAYDNVTDKNGDKYGFWRVKDKSAPHNSVISTKNILGIAEDRNYRTTSDQKSVLNYVAEEVNLDSNIIANTVTIPFSSSNIVKYEYDEETKTYIRYSRGVKQVDWDTKETVTTKNVIITFARYSSLNDEKGRQTLSNIGSLEGYYITNGKAIKITCEKTARASQTVYKDLEGNEIQVNDGNTFFAICPIGANVTFEPGEVVETDVTNTVN